MADVKESAMSAASDCKWVRALDANGNSIRISKEDHAKVVGELLPIPIIVEMQSYDNKTVAELKEAIAAELKKIPTSKKNNFIKIVVPGAGRVLSILDSPSEIIPPGEMLNVFVESFVSDYALITFCTYSSLTPNKVVYRAMKQWVIE